MTLQRYIPCGLLLLFLAACSSQKPAVRATPASSSTSLKEEDRIKFSYTFFDAQKEKVTGNNQRAAELFASCLRIDPKSAAAMYELASIYSESRKIGDALFFARSAAEIDPGNPWYQLLLADTYEKSGKYSEAIQIYQKLYRKNPSNIEYLFSEADAWLMQGKAIEAIRVYDEIEKQMGPSEEMTRQKQRLYLKMGKVDDAAGELEKLIRTDPSNLEYYSLLVELWQVNNQPEKAMATIRRMQAIDPDHPSVALALAEQYRSEGKKEESFQQLKKAFTSTQLQSEVKIRILTSYLPLVVDNEEMMRQALELSELASKAHPSEANPQTVYGDFLNIAKKYEQARVQYRAGLALDKKNIQAWQQVLLIESELRDWSAMESEAEEALGMFPDQSIFYLFNGIAKIQNKKYDDAARTLLAGSKLVVDNDQQQLEFYSNLGDVYDKLGKFSDSDKYYQKALNIDPSNDNVLNNWAYYLSLRKEQLDKAAEMSKRSNELRPNTSSYLDTYGWILYVQGKYSDALEWLDKALKAGGDQSGTILEHFGDTLFRLGRTAEALEYWERARKTGDHSGLLEKKLNDKKLYE